MPVINAQAFENSMINALAVSDPQLSTALGTPVRKIITAVAQEMASYNIDINTTTTLYSLDSVSGTELDYLVGQFGFTRQEAKSARGSVTIRRDNGDSLLQVPYGSQFYKQATSTSPSVMFQTTAYQELAEGVLSAEVAVVSTVAGSIGNVPAGTITYTASPLGYVNVTNSSPTSGGRDAETDAQLRQRFLQTIFRNVSGTSDQMLGLALAHEKVSKANMIGAESRYAEIVQAESYNGRTAAFISEEQWNLDVGEMIDPVHRLWAVLTESGERLGIGDYEYIEASGRRGVAFKDRSGRSVIGPVAPGVILPLYDYDMSSISSISVVRNDTGESFADYSETEYVDSSSGKTYFAIEIDDGYSGGDGISLTVTVSYEHVAAGAFVTIEFDYVSKHARRFSSGSGVDLYVDAQSWKNVTDIQYIDFSKVITSTPNIVGMYEHLDGTAPTVGHLYVPLSYQPMYGSIGFVNMGTSIVLREGVHYLPIYDKSGTKGSSRGIDAIEILGSVNSGSMSFDNDPSISAISDGTPISVPYMHNYAVDDVQRLVDQQRVATMDILVHEARRRRFVVYLTLMYSVFPRGSIETSVTEAVTAWAENLPFGHTVQFSDIETVAANTPGVDNVRVSTSADSGGRGAEYPLPSGLYNGGAYGIVELNRDGETYKELHSSDFRLAQNELFEVVAVKFYSKSQQGW